MSSSNSGENKKNKFETIEVVVGMPTSKETTKRIIQLIDQGNISPIGKRIQEGELFHDRLKVETISSPNNIEYEDAVRKKAHMEGGFIPPTEEELKCGFNDDEILYKDAK